MLQISPRILPPEWSLYLTELTVRGEGLNDDTIEKCKLLYPLKEGEVMPPFDFALVTVSPFQDKDGNTPFHTKEEQLAGESAARELMDPDKPAQTNQDLSAQLTWRSMVTVSGGEHIIDSPECYYVDRLYSSQIGQDGLVFIGRLIEDAFRQIKDGGYYTTSCPFRHEIPEITLLFGRIVIRKQKEIGRRLAKNNPHWWGTQSYIDWKREVDSTGHPPPSRIDPKWKDWLSHHSIKQLQN